MIFVDSSVWIDFFRDVNSPTVIALDAFIGQQVLATGDLVLTEVLQGTDGERAFKNALMVLQSVEIVDVGGADVAIQAARNYRLLRAKGIIVRKTIDTLIATRCILDGHELLHSDRDFDPFVEHLGLRLAKP